MEEENCFKVYLASSTGFFWDFFSFTDLWDSVELGLKAPVIFLSKILSAFPRSFGDSFNTSCHANCCPETRLYFFAKSCGIRSPVLSRRPLSSKLNSLFLFPLTKKATSVLGFWPIIWPLSPSSPCQVIHSGYCTDLCPSSLSTRVRLRSTDSLTYILYFLQQVGRGVDLHSSFLLLTVSLWGLLIQTQKGRGNFLFVSSQWESTWHI